MNANSPRAIVRTVRSFAIVGGAGFAVEAVLMTVLTGAAILCALREVRRSTGPGGAASPSVPLRSPAPVSGAPLG